MENTFSIIIPTYNRGPEILRALRSLEKQSYPKNKFEVIIVDDGSTDRTQLNLEEYGAISQLDIIVHEFKENKGRLAARNEGMSIATKDWICWLDSDDEYASTYLETLNNAINQFPDYKIFNFGTVVYDEPNFSSRLRDAFVPQLREDARGHDKFKSGGISTGAFIFKRALVSEVGLLPTAATPYGDDGSFPAKCTARWPELAEIYGRNEAGQWLPFGNPWGDDWVYFYLLTRKNLCKTLNIHLYVQHIRH